MHRPWQIEAQNFTSRARAECSFQKKSPVGQKPQRQSSKKNIKNFIEIILVCIFVAFRNRFLNCTKRKKKKKKIGQVYTMRKPFGPSWR